MSESKEMLVRFWGVRGSIACPGPDTVRYGGNTSCVEVRCGDHIFIFDAGTGLRGLGKALAKEGVPVDADIFCSHTHFDHICGVAFFAPCFMPSSKLKFWGGGSLGGRGSIEDVLVTSLSEPFLPNLRPVMSARMMFEGFRVGDSFRPRSDVLVRTAPLNHPGDATGYRLEWGGKSVAYITDTEHRAGGLDPNVLGLVDRVDLMIYDATYTAAEYGAFAGWGHSTWQEAVRLAETASVKQLVLFHHDPSHTDDILDAIGVEVTEARDSAVLAREGMSITL